MKILRALPLLIVVLGCSGMSAAEPEWYNKRIQQHHYDFIKNEIEKQGYADISIAVDNSDYILQRKDFSGDSIETLKKPKNEEERKRQDEILDKLREKVQQRKEKAVEAIRDKLNKEMRNGSRHFEIRGDSLRDQSRTFFARIWGHEAFDIVVTVEEIAAIWGNMPGVPFASDPVQTLDVFDTEAVKLLQQPAASSRGYAGEGQLIAVLDDFINATAWE